MRSDNKLDRRVSRTRRLLRSALLALILERGYSAVTIEDITERADLGRTTFYLHYHDKEELLIESLEAIAEDLKEQIEDLAARSLEEGTSQTSPLAMAFRHADENRDLYRIILKGEGGSRAANRIREIIEEAAAEFFSGRLQKYMEGEPEIPTWVLAGYFASAMLGFMTWWLEKEMHFGGDEAAGIFLALFFQGAKQIMHLKTEF